MSMTIQQAIENRERCYKYLLGCEAKTDRESVEAVRLSLEALREKAERENPQPLTLEELRQMDGQPVWIDDWWEDSHGWELSMDAADYFEGERRTEKEYGSIWVAYRHKPKEG